MIDADIDIDVAERKDAVQYLRGAVPAMMVKDGKQVNHPVGLYFQEIPVNPLTGFSSIDYKKAETIGYQKIDILSNHVYDDIESDTELEMLMVVSDFTWELILNDVVIEQLPHIHKYGNLIKRLKPKSVEDLAVIIAVIRPAHKDKRHLSLDDLRDIVWETSDGYSFKKSHAIAYAMTIIVSLNKIINSLSL